jgi:hypothetical protein
MSSSAYIKYFNNKISHLSFLSENYKIEMNKSKYSLSQFNDKIIFNKELLNNYIKVNKMKLKIIIKDSSNNYYYKADFILI